MSTRQSVTCTAACLAVLTTLGCAGDSQPAPATETKVAADVVIDFAADEHRLVVRNDRAQRILVLDTAMEPQRRREAGTLTFTYVRPGSDEGAADEPAFFEAVPVEPHGKTSIDPRFSLREGDRLKFCLEVVDDAAAVGGGDTRVHDREPGEPAFVACSQAFTVR